MSPQLPASVRFVRSVLTRRRLCALSLWAGGIAVSQDSHQAVSAADSRGTTCSGSIACRRRAGRRRLTDVREVSVIEECSTRKGGALAEGERASHEA